MVRPIDLQDNFSKAPLAGREQQVQQASPEMAQRQLGREQANEQALNQSRTLPGEESGAAELRADDEEDLQDQRRQQGRKKKKKKTEDASQARPAADGEPHFFDVIA